MDALIIIFAFLAGIGLIGVVLTRDEGKNTEKGKKLVSLRDLVTERKISMYAFLIFFMLMSLQINVAYGGLQMTTQVSAPYNVIENTTITNVPACTGASCTYASETSNTITRYPMISETSMPNSLASNLSTALILVAISVSLLVIALLSDLIQILVFTSEWLNNRR